jgi:hypothetical protein
MYVRQSNKHVTFILLHELRTLAQISRTLVSLVQQKDVCDKKYLVVCNDPDGSGCFDFRLPDLGERDHVQRNYWTGWELNLRPCVGDDPPWRPGKVDMGFERS